MKPKVVHHDLKIDGMTCNSCEMRIKNALHNLDGIIDAEAFYTSSIVKFSFDETIIAFDEIIRTIERLGYKVSYKSTGSGAFINLDQKYTEDNISINQLLGIGIILFAFYMIIRNTIGFNFIPQVDQSMSYGLLFVVGILTSLHCISMCGGINLSQCVSYDFEKIEVTKFSRLKPSFLYNLGRVISYTIVGGIVGALGSVFSFSGTAKGIVAIVAGLFMIIMGANMLNLFPWLRKFNPRLPKVLGNKIAYNNSKHKPLYVGLLNGLMPCGPSQAMQIYALATGSFIAGALSMLVFSLGTVPLMFGLGAMSSLLSAKFTKRIMKVSAVLVIFLGIIMLNRGLNLGGINALAAASSLSSSTSASSGNVAQIAGNVQTITTTMDSGRYTAIVVQKGIPVKWTITAQPGDLNGCNNPVTIPKFNIEKKLLPGDNLIEFTPAEEGNITYTCWMGMISSNIKVVADVTQVTAADIQPSNNIGNSGFLTGGSCCLPGSQTTKSSNEQILPADSGSCCKKQ